MVFTAKCGCKYKVTDTHVWYLESFPDEPEQWEILTAIPTDLEPPETPTGWANENIIWPHEKECVEAQERWVKEGMKVVRRLLFKRQFSEGLTLFRVIGDETK